MSIIDSNDKTADFVASPEILENKRKVVFSAGRDLNVRDVLSIDVGGQWWRIKTKDGKLHLVNAANVNYATIS